VLVSIASCQIVHIYPDLIGLKLPDMLSGLIKKLIPNPEHRPLHAFFIDRGYMELAKWQNVRDDCITFMFCAILFLI
jgi:hypothetical protein